MKAGYDITDAVHPDMPHVKFATGVWKHGQHIKLFLGSLENESHET
jgi:hypothetical protein